MHGQLHFALTEAALRACHDGVAGTVPAAAQNLAEAAAVFPLVQQNGRLVRGRLLQGLLKALNGRHLHRARTQRLLGRFQCDARIARLLALVVAFVRARHAVL